MKFENTFTHGLRLILPTGGTRLVGSCQWWDDPKVVIEGRILRRYHTVMDPEPEKVEELPAGTEVHLWDEDAGHPLLGTID